MYFYEHTGSEGCLHFPCPLWTNLYRQSEWAMQKFAAGIFWWWINPSLRQIDVTGSYIFIPTVMGAEVFRDLGEATQSKMLFSCPCCCNVPGAACNLFWRPRGLVSDRRSSRALDLLSLPIKQCWNRNYCFVCLDVNQMCVISPVGSFN